MNISQDPAAAQHEPKFTVVVPGQPTGWAAMAKEVRDFDEEKVQSCKDDVDTLLVFAGLFSAVLSAFLVAAYPNLQPSPMDMMNYQLERIANQTASYDIINGKLVATNPTSSAFSFQASSEDIRVNIAWFASLILSLMTASFGMLVKQWLREFLAVENPSPQARLRIRHFREPQLRNWRVYDLVACLPLLLQLSLALFFVGLCFFTASVHASVGYTTLPLVVGWALCFFGSTTLPIFFPRCPYRTTLLKHGVSRLHRLVSRVSRPRIFVPAQGPSTNTASSASAHLPTPLTGRTQPGTFPGIFIWSLWQQLVLTASQTIAPALDSIRARITMLRIAERRLRVDISNSWRARFVKWHNVAFAHLQNISDEKLLVDDPSSDINILVSVDAIQANDELLATIQEALQYIYPRPHFQDVIAFIVEVASHRLPTMAEADRFLPEWPFDGFCPLDSLRPNARTALTDILVGYVGEIEMYFERLNPQAQSREDRLDRYARTSLYALTLLLSAFASSADLKFPLEICTAIRDCFDKNEVDSDTLADVALLITVCCKDREGIWRNGSRLLTALTRMWILVNPRFDYGVKYFKAIQAELATVLQITGSFDWDSWVWPSDAPQVFQDASMEYVSALVRTEFQRVISEDKYGRGDVDTQSLKTIYHCLSRWFRVDYTTARSSKIEQGVQDLIAFALCSEVTAAIALETCKFETGVSSEESHYKLLKMDREFMHIVNITKWSPSVLLIMENVAHPAGKTIHPS